jgi:sec-independent protein translocase protein TatC
MATSEMSPRRLRRRKRAPVDDEGRMPLMAHLRELRGRLVKSFAVVALGAVVGWVFYQPIFDVLSAPVAEFVEEAEDSGRDVKLVLAGIADAFMLQIKVAAITGVVIASPVWIYQIWAFITPGLHRHERRWAFAFVAVAVPLFLGGVYLAYWVLPMGLDILFGFTPEDVSNYVAVNAYLNFLLRMVIVFGIGFLVPIFIVALNLAGILPAKKLMASWRWTVLGTFLFAAIATPTGDPINFMLLAVPILFLIGFAFAFAWVHDRAKARRHPEQDYDSLDDDEASPLEAPEHLAGPADSDTPAGDE